MDRKAIHFIGIGGIGVSALAQVSLARGNIVSGSDANIDTAGNPALARLIAGGATVYSGHAAPNLPATTDIVVRSAAIPDDNPEIEAAISRGIPIVGRAHFLGQLMAAHNGPRIAVAGTHGKTTTTGMIGVMLQSAGLDPTVFVGGEIEQLGGNVRIGSATGPFVVEACEAYDSFLSLKPDIAVVTNIEADHLDHYHSFDGVLGAFEKFLTGVPSSGSIVACMDDPGVRRLERDATIDAEFCLYGIEFGIDSPQGVKFADSVVLGQQSEFTFEYQGEPVSVEMNVPGRHNVENALSAVIVGSILGLTGNQIAQGLGEFVGATRRQEVLAEVPIQSNSSIVVIDDYAHHPTEISATISAISSAYPDRRIVGVFQPHLYSRTRDFLQGFAESLSAVGALVVTGIYAAREKPIAGVRAADIVHLAAEINPGLVSVFVPDRHDVPRTVAALTAPNDVVLFMGAGDIREQAEQYISLIRKWS